MELHEVLLFGLLVLSVFSMAGAQVAGWINIDCGATSDYTDPVTGIEWVTDLGYVSTGVNVEVPNALAGYKDFAELTTVRVFNNSRAKNCYALAPVTPNNTYVIRASFLYESYDNAATSSPLPTFQVAIETTVTANVTFLSAQNLRILEFTLMAMNDTIHLCLVQDESLSNPFVSAIVVREIDQAVADVWFNSSNPSELSKGFIFRARGRVDFGGLPNEVVRYPFDHLDRYWIGANNMSAYVNQSRVSIKNVSSPALISQLNNVHSQQVPGVVLSTALSPTTISNFTISLPNVTRSYLAWLNIYFVELDSTANTSSARRFGVHLVSGSPFLDVTVDLDNPKQSGGFAAYIYRNLVYTSTTKIRLYPVNPTKRPPLVNAMEWFQVINETAAPTDSAEVIAIETIKSKLNLSDWVGDPCLPSPYNWLTCSIVSMTNNPQILELNLSSYGLVGSIPPQISQLNYLSILALDHNMLTGPIPDLSALTSLKKLDLQNNNLSGPIPDWLASMPSLSELFLQNNNFSGKIPAALLNKTGSNFTFMYGGNPNLNTSSTNVTLTTGSKSSKESSTGIIIGVVIGGSGALIVIIILCITGICLCCRKKEKPTDIGDPNGGVREISYGNGDPNGGVREISYSNGDPNGGVSEISHGNGTILEGANEEEDTPTPAASHVE